MTDARTAPPKRGRGLWLWLAAGAIGIAAATGITVYLLSGAKVGTTALAAELRDRGRFAIVGDGAPSSALEVQGAEVVPASSVPGLEAALRQDDEHTLDTTMQRAGLAGLVVDARRPGEGDSLSARLTRCEHFLTLGGVYLTPGATVYVRRRLFLVEPDHGTILARAARQIAAGARLPNVRAFPEPLRRSQSVEVLVMFRQDGTPKLWRSARGGSIARALITATSVARERWDERRTMLGGSMAELLPRLTIEVYLLEEDGTIGDRSVAFLERVITPAHGVAFEDRSSWHYLLPPATEERGRGSAVHAYRELFAEAEFRPDSLSRSDIRLYRIVARRVGISAPSAASGAGVFVPPPPIEGSLGGGASTKAIGLDVP